MLVLIVFFCFFSNFSHPPVLGWTTSPSRTSAAGVFPLAEERWPPQPKLLLKGDDGSVQMEVVPSCSIPITARLLNSGIVGPLGWCFLSLEDLMVEKTDRSFVFVGYPARSTKYCLPDWSLRKWWTNIFLSGFPDLSATESYATIYILQDDSVFLFGPI